MRQTSEQLQPKAWHRQVLSNRYLDWQQSKCFQTETSFEDPIQQLSQQSLSVILFEEKMQQHLKLAMQTLEPRQRAALILHFYQNYTQEQVAEILGMSVQSLHTMFDNVRKKLQRKLAKLIIFSSKTFSRS